MQRLRLAFSKEDPLRFIGHLDVVRLWERACRRARVPLAYTLGYSPHPRLQFAAPLALGVTGEEELVDVFLTTPLTPNELRGRLEGRLPPGCRLVRAGEVPLLAPAASALLRWADYRVLAAGAEGSGSGGEGVGGSGSPRSHVPRPTSDMPEREAPSDTAEAPGSRWAPGAARDRHAFDEAELAGLPPDVPWRPPAERLPPPAPAPPAPSAGAVQARIAALLAASSLPRQRVREGKAVSYDLRPLIVGLWLEEGPTSHVPRPTSHVPRPTSHVASGGRPPPSADSRAVASTAGGGGGDQTVTLGVRLRADPTGQGRPEEVAAALGLQARRIHRVRLGLVDDPGPAGSRSATLPAP